MAIDAEETLAEREGVSLHRYDFIVTTANKQLNFLQHVHAILEEGGRAGVVVPDNVLFERGAAEVVRRHLLQNCTVHTLLRLPTGIFYAQGVKANVLFFDKVRRKPGSQIWVYDLRAGLRFSVKSKPLTEADLSDFVECHINRNGSAGPSDRWRCFNVDAILAAPGCRLDLSWEKPERICASISPRDLGRSIVVDLKAALAEMESVQAELE